MPVSMAKEKSCVSKAVSKEVKGPHSQKGNALDYKR